MRIVIFDVSNGNCGLVVGDNGNSMMIDCGSHLEKPCPVDAILNLKRKDGWLEHMKDFEKHSLAKLVISHPDMDHIKNSAKVHSHLRPRLISRRKLTEYPTQMLATDDDSFKEYESKFCKAYTSPATILPDWAFSTKSFQIPFDKLSDDSLFGISSFKNNSSLVYLLEFGGIRVMFCGDMEKEGWVWLLKNDASFLQEMSKGIDILIASHHGHKSGYSNELMKVMGDPKLTIISKGTETGALRKVAPQYSAKSTGLDVKNLSTKSVEKKYSVSTRANGRIYLDFKIDGSINVFSEK